ncbi:MAG TPA: hypothetical protein VLY04_15865 [Bryobacteraceae bacterium]|nr:hypothetical protein [Bryobacteraceae bacterium]
MLTVAGCHLNFQTPAEQISRAPHWDSLRAAVGSELARSGQKRPAAAALQAGFLGCC